MSKLTKEINHNFNIGDCVFVLDDYAIVPCLIIGIESNPVYTSTINKIPSIDKNTISYKLLKIRRNRNDKGQTVFEVSISEYDRYDYHSSKVYGSVDELLSDLEKTIEKSL